MCGIVGVVYRDGERPKEAIVSAMASTIAHRGPDGQGIKVFDQVGLGHRRLAVIDLSDAASQPMGSTDQRLWITFNGEIYNFKELQTDLLTRGHRFATQSDTEVILEAYLEWGPDCVAKLDGMFAFALWDTERKTLLFARDRTGKKPLYIYEDDRKLVFASEIKAILAHPAIDEDLRPESFAQFLTHGYVPTPATFYRKIRKVEPSFYELHTLATRTHRAVRYWDIPIGQERPLAKRELPEVEARIRELFFESVKRRMISDVPIGAFLSGGIDSTLVVAAMAQLSPHPIRTFSIGFEGYPAWDETRYARLVSERYGTRHTEFKVRPESFGLLDKLAWHYDEPFADSSAIPTYIVSKLTREHVTVALTGDGGDEVFAGYPRFFAAQLAERVPANLRRVAHALLKSFPVGSVEMAPLERARRLAMNMSREMPERLRSWLSLFSVAELQELLTPDYARFATPSVLGHSYAVLDQRAAQADPVNRALYINARTYLLDDLNVKVDRASMAVGLETRSPFLDTQLMEYVARLPGNLKVRGNSLKWLLKRAMSDLLPPPVVNRKKMGFGVPLGAWFQGELAATLDQELAHSALVPSFVTKQGIEKTLSKHQTGTHDRALSLWSLLMLDRFIGRRAQRTAAP